MTTSFRSSFAIADASTATMHPLDVFLAPASVAIFGANEIPGSVERNLMWNLVRHHFGGLVFPICPAESSLLGIKAYRDLGEVPAPVELAIIASAADRIPAILDQCLSEGVKGAILFGSEDASREASPTSSAQKVRERIRRSSMRILGMSSAGVACPRTGFNATSAPAMVPPGKVGLLCQSGALITALFKQEHSEQVGCTAAISVGSTLDISWAEWLRYLAGDPHTECIGLFMEHVDDARAFFAAAREVAASKPIVLFKGGSEEGQNPSRNEVFDEACRCNGILRVQKLADLFRMAAHLTTQPVTRGRRLAVVTNVHGPAIVAADALREAGGRLATLTPHTMQALSTGLTAPGTQNNPLDLPGDTDAARFLNVANLVAADPQTDALLLILGPAPPMDPVAAAAGLRELREKSHKPVLACWMWAAATPSSIALLREAGIPNFHSPESAVRAFRYLCQHAENLRFLAEIRQALDAVEDPFNPAVAEEILGGERERGQTLLSDVDACALLSAYGLPVQHSHRIVDEEQAIQVADALDYPVTIELSPEGVDTRSGSDVIRLKAEDTGSLERAFRTVAMVAKSYYDPAAPFQAVIRPVVGDALGEVAISSVSQTDLGPMIRLGTSGRSEDIPLQAITALAPLTPLTVREMIQKSPVLAALSERHGETLDLDALERFLLRLSRLVCDQPRIKELIIPSLLILLGRVLARDVRVVLHEAE